MKNMFNLNGANCSNGSGMVAKLTANEIKEFLEKTYLLNVVSIERVESRITNFINFKIIGRYLHAGFNNVSFDGVFYASDTMYIFDTIVEKFQKTYHELWKDFLLNKFGDEYERIMK